MRNITSISLCIIMIMVGSVSAFAVENNINSCGDGLKNEKIFNANNIDITNKEDELLLLLRENGNINTDDLVIKKMNIKTAEKYITNVDNINMAESDIYYIENKKGMSVEKSILADMAVATSGNSGENVRNGSSARVVASCVIGYEAITRNTVEYIKGTYFGGRIVSQPNSSVISSLKGIYYETGPYITISGDSGIATEYTTSANFDVGKHTTLQKKNISRTRYFNSEVASAAVKAKYSVAGTVNNGNQFSFDVIASAF